MDADDWTGKVSKELFEIVRNHGGLGCYLMIIKRGGLTETSKAVIKDLDGFHFYAHLLSSLNDDVKSDLAPYLSVKIIDDGKLSKNMTRELPTQ